MFTALSYGIPKMPVSLINLPNKEYWLGPERKEETFSLIRESFLWFGSATMLLLIDIFRQVFIVNINGDKSLSHPLLALGCYMAFALVWSIGMIARFVRMKAPRTGPTDIQKGR
jgi:hypothetical protein